MQSGDLLSSDVSEFRSRILVNGVERDVITNDDERSGKWEVSRELTGDLPAQVVAGAGITTATGMIRWAKESDVSEREIHPWSRTAGWPPSSGDRVEIWSGDGTNAYRIFTGRIDETTGDVGGDMQSSIVDDIDKLNVRFSHDAMLRIMPPRIRGGKDIGAGLSSLYYVDAALRKAGFYATPPAEPRPIVSVPMQSSWWPEYGVLYDGTVGGFDGAGPWASKYDAPWGVSMGGGESFYSPRIQSPITEPTQFTIMVAPDHTGNTFISAFYDDATDIGFDISTSRTVFARLDGVEVCQLIMGDATMVTLHVDGDFWELKSDTGGYSIGTTVVPTTTGQMDRIVIQADDNSRIAGFQASHTNSTSRFQSLDYVRTANYEMADMRHMGIMDACPALESTTVVDLLQEISNATLSAMWIDEHGVFQWVPSTLLRAKASSQTVTTLDDIRSLSWSDSLLSVRSKVDVDHRKPAVTMHRWDNVTFYEGSGGSINSEETMVEFLEPGADTDWIGMSPVFAVVGDTAGAATANSGQGSIAGAMLVDGETELSFTNKLSATLEVVAPGVWKLTQTMGSLTSTQHAVLQYPSQVQSVAYRYWNKSLPIIRGFGKTDWTTLTYRSPITGPSWAPVLVHDCGHWNARTDEQFVIERIADFLAEQITKPAPTITGMRVGFDPRRQLGDVITIRSEKLLGLELTALVVGKQESSDGSYTQTLAVRIISANSTYTTYEQFSEAWGPTANYDAFSAAWGLAATYDDFTANPLEVTA